MNEYLLVLTTLPSGDLANQMAVALVEQRLAACVNILPAMTSVYKWKGRLEQGTEYLMLIKTRQQHYQALAEFIRSHHPYELPEIIATPIEHGLAEYLQWIDECTGDATSA